jgi:NAD(P)-dependent dehydrogenase (short-subunit alcohol dehydrogenase family)
MGRKAVAIQADPALAESATAAVEQAVEELGGLDILVNNAGVLFAGYFSTQPLREIDLVGGLATSYKSTDRACGFHATDAKRSSRWLVRASVSLR